MERFEIQTRQKGAWLRHIGSTDRTTIENHWPIFCNVRRCAARLVKIAADERVTVLAKKKRTLREGR